MSETGWYTCKAGFRHAPGTVCTHIATQVPGTPAPAAPFRGPRYRLPREHDSVIVNADGEVTGSYKKGGIYSEAALAERRAENKIKYMPTYQREQLEEMAKREDKAHANSKFMAE